MRVARKVPPILMSAILAVSLCPGLGLVAQSVAPDAAHADSAIQVMHRLYNPNSGEHFYTASEVERDAVAGAGWDYEGEGWTAPVTSSTPVYRLYSGTDHHYTTSAVERDHLVSVGWSDEGTGWYSDDAQGVPLYRQFNPNVDPNAPINNSGSHNYTTSLDEHSFLVSIGWNDEGIGWYGVDTSASQMPTAPEGIVYQDNVVEVPAADYSGLSDGSVTIAGDAASGISEGSVLLLSPAQDNPAGSALKVQSIQWQDGSLVTTTVPAELDDVVETMSISGTTESVVSISPDVEVIDDLTAQSTEFSGTVNMKGKTFKPFKNADVTVKISPSVEYSLDFAWGKINECKLTATVDTNAHFEWKHKQDQEVKLCTATFSTPVAGLTVSADIFLTAHVTGEVTIDAKLSTSAGIKYDGKKVSPVTKSDFSYEAAFDAVVGAGVRPDLCLKYFGIGIADVSPEAGLKVEGKMQQHGAKMTCADLSAWVYMDIGVGKGDTLLSLAMDLLDLKKDYHPLTKDNAKISRTHVENGKVVPECTWGKGPGGDDPDGSDGNKDIELPVIQETIERNFTLPTNESVLWIPITTATDCAAIQVEISDPEDGKFDAALSYGAFTGTGEDASCVAEKGISLYASYAIQEDDSTTLGLNNAGTYYLRITNACYVNPYYYDTDITNKNTLHLKVTVLNNDPNENNNDYTTATQIKQGESTMFRLLGKEDVDVFAFQVPRAGRMTINVWGQNDTFDSKIGYTIFGLSEDKSTNSIGELGVSSFASYAFNTAKTKTFEVPAAGTYYVKVANAYYWNPYYYSSGLDNKTPLYISCDFN